MAEGVVIEFGADKGSYPQLIGVDIETAVGAARNLVSAGDADVRVNGSSQYDGANTLNDGDTIVFVKKAGSKGN